MSRRKKHEEGDLVLVIPIPKPRKRALNEALVNAGGGRMKSPKDYSRTRAKRELQADLEDT